MGNTAMKEFEQNLIIHSLFKVLINPYLKATRCSFGEFHKFFLDLQKVQEIIRKHQQTFMQWF